MCFPYIYSYNRLIIGFFSPGACLVKVEWSQAIGRFTDATLGFLMFCVIVG